MKILRVWPFRNLRREVANQLPVLPVLVTHVAQTAQQVEQAVVETCSHFQGMAMRAQTSVTQAQAAIGGKAGQAEASLEDVLATARETLEQLLRRGERSAELSRQTAERMVQAEQAIARIAQTTRRVDEIAFGIKLVALNAKIESVHVGEQGAAFGVVADEIGRHAEDSAHIADDIQDTMTALLANARETRQALTDLVAADCQALEQSRRDVQRALDALQRAHAHMAGQLAEAADSSRVLAGDIAAAITSLQFQDRVNQRLSHVADALTGMHEALGAAMHAKGDAAPAAASGALATLATTYTMAEERAAHDETPELAPTGTEGGSIELF